MNTISRSFIVSVAAVTALAAIPGGGAVVGSAVGDSPTLTKRLVARSTGEHDVGRTFLGTDKVRSRSTGRVVGFDSFTGRLFPAQERAVVQVAVALKGGIVVFRASVTGSSLRFNGPILRGTGSYRGIEGTVTGRATEGQRTFYTLHYHL
ncbi:hypothetical protein ACT8ZV_05780 [Nocardioides sp. MAHUQ-72]|uniref:hypothetical protein n=1 Tax=unclassified Nocardioides TaxID=2615069 RepID=UPI00361640CA